MEAFRGFCQKYRVDPETKKNRFAVVQAEDELAAIGVVIGAGWAGARAFTPTAGPGISLMNEFIGLAYFAEVPAVIFDVQRTGPSTGMPTRTQQGDLMMCAYASHGDTRHICLYPADPKEAFEMAVASFDLAERFQTPVFVLSDLDIGMNDWIVPKLEVGRRLSPRSRQGAVGRGAGEGEELLPLPGRGRRRHPVPRRCRACIPKGAYFTRGSGHNKYAGYTEDDVEYTEVLDRIDRKIQRAAKAVPAPVVRKAAGAKMGLITVGGCHAACIEALDILGKEGVAIDYMRVRGFPFGEDVRAFVESHDVTFVVEQNRDAQLRSLIVARDRRAHGQAGVGALLRRLPDERPPRHRPA